MNFLFLSDLESHSFWSIPFGCVWLCRVCVFVHCLCRVGFLLRGRACYSLPAEGGGGRWLGFGVINAGISKVGGLRAVLTTRSRAHTDVNGTPRFPR